MRHVLSLTFPCLLSPQPPIFPASAESGLQTHTDHNPLSLTSHWRIKDKATVDVREGTDNRDRNMSRGRIWVHGQALSAARLVVRACISPAPVFLAQTEGRARQKEESGGREGLRGYNP